MEKFIDWVIDNKVWLFSGVGTVVIGWLVRLIFKKRNGSTNQKIRSGDNSINIQAGKDVNIGSKKGSDEKEE